MANLRPYRPLYSLEGVVIAIPGKRSPMSVNHRGMEKEKSGIITRYLKEWAEFL
ncbi:MAG: hypothetical protein J7545_03375 [Roseofilum sp. SBFL]|uniref:hypothetical protein n=1 Tax=unclassified Roseofilum TaxID=2620099 RepID=UPI001B28C746|nr:MULTISPECIES: hypothetical protein [unclassified Roseofilum]MBP0013554.1 hypothetical protein [Roseofilum sp. SID3]MBP0022555.1 hypothetical protein [Roseofilum sp. SID2]MBP0039842.1 hypothetical protein [Roseofilum sp. SID1]MBP0041006.1 hypothetical protein [Roseofilum sp. SBFL]